MNSSTKAPSDIAAIEACIAYAESGSTRGKPAGWHGEMVHAARKALRALASTEQASAVSPPAPEPAAHFGHLVELFLPDGGNSTGFYHTGFTTLGGDSRSTRDPWEAKRYGSLAAADFAANKLFSKLGVWRAVEYGFDIEKQTEAARDVLAERRRQISVEGWSPDHDDRHIHGEMARAAACYALGRHLALWPWGVDWWKPSDRRRNLVKAVALGLAEIERLDRIDKHGGALEQQQGHQSEPSESKSASLLDEIESIVHQDDLEKGDRLQRISSRIWAHREKA